MTIYDIIEKKRYGTALTNEEINFAVEGFTADKIPDYQMSALLMAICINGMDESETFALTQSMLHSGDVINLSKINGVIVDKHSTGGVGDSTTLALAPILACCGVKVAKMSGRGLGFTGGTIDKLESIPNFSTALSEDKFIEVVNSVGCCVIGQTANLVPADKKLYALRDVTATIDSIPLICGSIMSKKLASGAGVVLLDVKYGSGAFMKTPERAVELAKLMVKIGAMAGKTFAALITDMDQPLSDKIGNTLEIIGAIEILKGKKNRLQREIYEVAKKLLTLAKIFPDESAAEKAIDECVTSGLALNKFKQMATAQGGNGIFIDHPDKFAIGKLSQVKASRSGYVSRMATEELGKALTYLGGGRVLKTDVIDHSVGLEMKVSLGDYVHIGDTIVNLYHQNKNLEQVANIVTQSIEITDEKPNQTKLAYAYVTENGVKYY